MKVTALEISAILENVTDLSTYPDYDYHIQFRCTNCGSETEKAMTFNSLEKIPVMNGKSFVNLSFKSIVEGSSSSYRAENAPSFQSIIELDCRGAEPIHFEPICPFICQSSLSKKNFTEVDLSESNWADYDDQANESVSILEFKHRFVPKSKSSK
ncbi:hypothetical protein SSS_05712 [Sarcoptes scabiei]|nr:hypothetical protein SSS_05712 [Sarcoptes scabiei]